MAAKDFNFTLANHATVKAAFGLTPSPSSPQVHPLLWLRTETGRRPDWVRWVWHPRSGEMRIGRVIHHYELIGKGEFNSWVRGFYFSRSRLVAVRTYFNPFHPLDDFDTAYRKLDKRVSERIVSLLHPDLPRARFETGVDNDWLENRFPRLCQW